MSEGNSSSAWVLTETSAKNAYKSTTDENSGQTTFILSRDDVGKIDTYGALVHAISAKPYLGKRIVFKAQVRAEVPWVSGPDHEARLSLDLIGQGFEYGVGICTGTIYQAIDTSPGSAKEWREYHISTIVPNEAEKITLGVNLWGAGRVWLRNPEVVVSETLDDELDRPRALTLRELRNVVAFARLLGAVRYFHPSDQAAFLDWGTFAIHGVREVVKARSRQQLVTKLLSLFYPIAPTVQIYTDKRSPLSLPRDLVQPINSKGIQVVAWQHEGFAGEDGQVWYPVDWFKKGRRSRPIENFSKNLASPSDPTRIDLGDNIYASVSTSLYADQVGTLPHMATVNQAPVFADPADRSTRLAIVALAWNVYQHFWPYFDLVGVNWDRELEKTLMRASQDDGARQFLDTLKLMVAKLNDGHARVWHLSEQIGYRLPLSWEWIDNELVITHVDLSLSHLFKPGGIVISINGKSARQVISDTERFVSAATPDSRRYETVKSLLFGAKDETVNLKIKNATGKVESVQVARTATYKTYKESTLGPLREIKPGIVYIDPSAVRSSDFEENAGLLERASGIIVDSRKYSSSMEVLEHYTDKQLDAPQFWIPTPMRPNHDSPALRRLKVWHLDPKKPRYKAKLAILIDRSSHSHAETLPVIAEAYGIGTLVGETTAANNGSRNPFLLPGGYCFSQTGMKFLKHDGSRYFGVGINPKIKATKTIRGIAAGRDELLEQAINELSK